MLDEVESRFGAVPDDAVVVVRKHLVDDADGHVSELREDLVRQQRARHHGRFLERARERGACVITRRERQGWRSLGLHTCFIGSPASGPNGG